MRSSVIITFITRCASRCIRLSHCPSNRLGRISALPTHVSFSVMCNSGVLPQLSSIFIPFRRSSRESATAGGIDLVTGWEKAKRRPRPGHCRDPPGKSGFVRRVLVRLFSLHLPKRDGKVKSESENSGKVIRFIFGGFTLSVSLSIL